jgi:hypothetical protein
VAQASSDRASQLPSMPGVNPDALGAFDGVVGGVIYGWLSKVLVPENQRSVDIFVNGLHAGIASVTGDMGMLVPNHTVCCFKLRLPTSLVVDAPVTIRARLVGTVCEIGNPLSLATSEEVRAALSLAQGSISLEGGTVYGVLHQVNPDALPLIVCAYANNDLIERIEIPRPDVPVQKGQQLDGLRFRIPLPASILDATPVNLSVKLEGSEVQLDGSPLIIAVASGTSITQRLTALEKQVQELSEAVIATPQQMVSDLAEQFHQFIVPRVDAIVQAQREMLESQMIELWRRLRGVDTPLERPGLPANVTQRMDQTFTGFGWSKATVGEQGGERWFTKSAFIAVRISPRSSLLLRISGSAIIGEPRYSGLGLSANGHRLAVTLADLDANRWLAATIVPSSVLHTNGVLGIQIWMPKRGFHPEAPANMPVSASVRVLEVCSLEFARELSTIDAGDDERFFVTGWYPMELNDKGAWFRWMGSHGIIVLPRSPAGSGSVRFLELRGPLIFNSASNQSLRAELGGKELPPGKFETFADGSWSVRFEVLEPQAQTGALLALEAPAHNPPNDGRMLSIAVSQIVLTFAPV